MNNLTLFPIFRLCSTFLCSATVLFSTSLPELSTDRPDATESPYTVPAGHWQIETDLFVYSKDASLPGQPRVVEKTYSIAVTNLKYGLSETFDLQLVIEPYTEIHTSNQGATTVSSGFGDLTIRAKWRFTEVSPRGTWALLPYLKIPTADRSLGNRKFEGGFVIPFTRELPNGWDFGFQTGAEWVRLDPLEKQDYAFTPLATIVFGHPLGKKAGVFFELAGAYDTYVASDSLALSFNTGGTYALNEVTQLDFGIATGLTRSATDLTLFTGYSQRW